MKTLLVIFIVFQNYYPKEDQKTYDLQKMEVQTENADACKLWAEAINTPNRGKSIGTSSWAYCK